MQTVDLRNQNLAHGKIAVIIATKNRADAIEKYALASLTCQVQSGFRDFICVVWDASDSDATQRVLDSRTWEFPVYYFHAPRVGSSSQRNDAVSYVLTEHPDVGFVLFIDDDCELSPDALGGVYRTFETTDASLVNVPIHPKPGEQVKKNFKTWLIHRLGLNRHWATDFLYNHTGYNELPGIDVDWTNGGGMAVRIKIFRDDGYFFPEPFQTFGGYAMGEDFAFSFFQRKKRNKSIVNAVEGYFIHYSTPGGRPDMAKWWAARWYNFHLLFDALYHDIHGIRKAWLVLKFKLFMLTALSWHLIRGRIEALKGITEAKKALVEYHKNSDILMLFHRNSR